MLGSSKLGSVRKSSAASTAEGLRVKSASPEETTSHSSQIPSRNDTHPREDSELYKAILTALSNAFPCGLLLEASETEHKEGALLAREEVCALQNPGAAPKATLGCGSFELFLDALLRAGSTLECTRVRR
eukprot:1691480-Rhodomonas_salina.3